MLMQELIYFKRNYSGIFFCPLEQVWKYHEGLLADLIDLLILIMIAFTTPVNFKVFIWQR